MKARLVKFGEIEVEGKHYTHDLVIDGGKVRKRKKGPSKEFREEFGHTPLSGRGRNSLGRQATPCGNRRPWCASDNGRSPSGGETARCAGHCGAYSGSLSAARGSEEGPGARHPALYVLTDDLDSVLEVWSSCNLELRSKLHSRECPA
jgi:hypothetical protein